VDGDDRPRADVWLVAEHDLFVFVEGLMTKNQREASSSRQIVATSRASVSENALAGGLLLGLRWQSVESATETHRSR